MLTNKSYEFEKRRAAAEAAAAKKTKILYAGE
jgi:hypothetical protein